ncbi:hypothetical protein BN128_3970 [Cronobacter sakazakii 696]|nr:hypothetical protein BN129_4241 [Cronobacter sakazakii 701]CCK05296.1 hypothetical protein BN128_3970 [Cronobacter sakazakii 696]
MRGVEVCQKHGQRGGGDQHNAACCVTFKETFYFFYHHCLPRIIESRIH